MDGFTLIDAVVAIVLLLSAILAYSRGIVRELMAILGWIVAAVVAFVFAPALEPLMHETPFLGGFLAGSCELAVIAAFALLFAVALVIASLFTPLFSSIVRRSALGGIDQGLGFLFGVARAVLLVAVAFLVYDRAMPGAEMAMVDNSRSAAVFSTVQDNIDDNLPDNAPGWLVRRYEQLMRNCAV
ncbi:colicin V production CvpA [Rhodobacteraceae bacterium WD3A24]|nr:colicin V production CvpA [Rhodobacteraceae bacterium WD3A24]